jgi:hypothetical protein
MRFTSSIHLVSFLEHAAFVNSRIGIFFGVLYAVAILWLTALYMTRFGLRVMGQQV